MIMNPIWEGTQLYLFALWLESAPDMKLCESINQRN